MMSFSFYTLCQLFCVVGAVLHLPAFTPLPVPNYHIPGLPVRPPGPVPSYMVNNAGNQYGVAPDKGTHEAPILTPNNATVSNHTTISNNATLEIRYEPGIYSPRRQATNHKRQSSSYWLADIEHGIMPNAPTGYKFYRNVRDYGAQGDGSTDDTAAINRAITDGNRCGKACGSTSTLGALVYFPRGTYMVSTPIIQYYYTQFVGDANVRPVIKGMANFVGIALIDTDVYIPGGNGAEWYINQNQFYRQIRNFVIDLTLMPSKNTDAGQNYVPTGIHWQVSQATSMQNVHFQMPTPSDANPDITHVGVFTENGSGGFVSDLTFFGGNYGMRIGSQQFTATNLYFTSCLTAISMIWDWGFTWRNINVVSCYVAIDCTQFGGDSGQGTGSISVVDSIFNGVPYGITTHAQGPTPSIVIDNLLAINSQSIITVSGVGPSLNGPTSGSQVITSYAMGRRYTDFDDIGRYQAGDLTIVPKKPKSLLASNGTYFQRSKPQYESLGVSSFVSVTSKGVLNDGTGDQTAAINSVLTGAGNSVVFFPAGIYRVEGTIKVPVGTKMVGEGWSQIMGTGSFFQDASKPKVLVQVGNPGDSGVIEISDFLFTVSGPTAGAILMEWNIKETTQGSAGMWDSHFRVGGAVGSELQFAQCPKSQGAVSKCIAASMLLHITKTSSGYFENVWAWTADHDLDLPVTGNDTSATQVSVFSARGLLVESQGPTWLWGTASEHNVLYQYQFLGANNIVAGMMQTESPYYQPRPAAPTPFEPGVFPSDPTFDTCVANSSCADSWALRIINTTNVIIHGAGFYSFFNDYTQDCVPLENCQTKVVDTSYSQGIFIYNIFTKGVVQIVSPEGGIPPVYQNDSNQSGYTSEVSAWLILAERGTNIGGEDGTANTPGTVMIKPLPCTSVPPSSTFTMSAACTSGILVLPTSGPDASSNNDPPGAPPVCDEVCDFERLLTGSCCGRGGSLGNPIEIPPSVTIPYDIVLSSGYVPNVPITIGSPGGYDPNSVYGTITTPTGGAGTTTSTTSSTPVIIVITTAVTSQSTFVTTSTNPGGSVTTKTTSTPVVQTTVLTTTRGGGGGGGSSSKPCGLFPPGTPLQTLLPGIPIQNPITLPGGLCNPLPTPIIIPPGPLPNADPPCFPPKKCTPCFAGVCGGGTSNGPSPDGTNPDPNDPADDPTECSADPDPSTDTGLCGNGNFPVWNDVTGEIDCSHPASEAGDYISQCQADADQNYDDTVEQIECQQQACDTGGSGTHKRAPKKPCPQPPSWSAGQAGICDATFNCDTDLWPNVCNNARSAMDKKNAPTVLTYKGDEVHLTGRWLSLHGYVGDGNNRKEGGDTDGRRDAGTIPKVAGWGLVGSPQGSGRIAAYNDRPTLRLIPALENGRHGNALKQFIKYTKEQLVATGKPNIHNPIYCVAITGNNKPADYCINDGANCKNKCAAAYGPAFILVNQITAGDRRAAIAAGQTDANMQRWDKWFDEVPSRKQLHTLRYDAAKLRQNPPVQDPLTATMPPQFGTAPSPGQKIYTGDFPNGNWVLSYRVTRPGPHLGQTVTVGVPRRRDPILASGTNLVYDDVPTANNGQFPSKRDVELMKSVVHEDTKNTNITSKNNALAWGMMVNPYSDALSGKGGMFPSRQVLSSRQVAGGSFLDPGVYIDVLECSLAGDGVACSDCDLADSQIDYDGIGQDAPYTVTGSVSGPGSTSGGGPTTTPEPTTTTTSGGGFPAPSTRGVEIYGIVYTSDNGSPFPATLSAWGELDYVPFATATTTGLCANLATNTLPLPNKAHTTDYPSSWAFTKPVQGLTSCTYLNPNAPSAATGTLKCPDLPTPVECDPVSTPKSSCQVEGDSEINYQALAFCVF